MKKTTVYIFVLVLSLSLLCACGDRNNNNPAETLPPANDNTAGSGNVNDNDGIITDEDDRGILGGNHNDATGEDDRNNDGGAVGEIIDGNAPAMPEPNIGDSDGGAAPGSGNMTGGSEENSRRARLR